MRHTLTCASLGYHRRDFLDTPMFRDGKTRYENSLETIFTYHHSEYDRLATDLTRSKLHAVWISQKCIDTPVSLFDGNLNSQKIAREKMDWSNKETFRFGHDTALGIAARSGDEWAIHSFLPPHLDLDPEYWKAMLQAKPLLGHRWLASVISASKLTENQQVWHAAKAYSLASDLDGRVGLADYVKALHLSLHALDENVSLPEVKGDGSSDVNLAEEVLLNKLRTEVILKYPW